MIDKLEVRLPGNVEVREEIAVACTCSLRPFPHHHSADLQRLLKAAWERDLKGGKE